MFSAFSNFAKILFTFILIICILYVPIFYSNTNKHDATTTSIYSKNNFLWPIPNYTNISSQFGKRHSPTLGASSFHSGIDIPAPEGTPIYAIDDGIITFASWGAGGGYTIVLELYNYSELKVSYCHVSPIMYVNKYDTVKKGTLIGSVGPKNVYGINNNPYKDSNGNPTNGATTGCHLHFTIKENNVAVNPLNFYELEF